MDEKKRTILILLAAAAILVLGSLFLNRIGQGREEHHVKILISQFLPGSNTIREEEITAEDEHVTAAWQGENGYVVETVMPGYVDDITVMTALDLQGKVTGVTIRSLHETLGLGRRAQWDEAFLRQFLGTQGYAEIGNGIDGLTGATVTSKAVAKAINSASAYVTGADGITAATEWGDT